MKTKKFDNLGIEPSLLGFGCMRFPLDEDGKINEKEAEKMIAEFFKSYPKWRYNQYFHTLPFRKKFFVYMVDWHAYSILRLYCRVQEFLFNKKFNI